MFGKTGIAVGQTPAEKTNDALGMFHKAIIQLKEANNEAEVIKEQNEEKIKALKAETSTLDTLTSSNGKVISNIEKLITVG